MFRKNNIIAIIFLIIMVLCPTSANANSEKINVVATTGMIADIASQIIGNNGTVTGLIGSGVDPHLYKPTRSDIVKLSRADIIFYNGLLLEGKMIDAIARVAKSGKPAIAVAEKIEKIYLIEPEGFSGHHDPHVWMDPAAWMKVVKIVLNSLVLQDPKNAVSYRSNAESYISNLSELDRYATSAIGSIPRKSRVLVTAHDAFSYFGRRFGFEVVGIQGISTESEAGVRDIEKIVQLLVERNISAVFVESTVADRNVRALIEGAMARNHRVVIGGQLFSDAMGKPGTYEGTYLGMIDHNVTTITKALGGKAPARGMKDKLRGEGK